MSDSPVLSYPGTQAVAPPAGLSLTDLCARAAALIQPMRESDQRFGPDIENGFVDLEQLVERFSSKYTPGRVASYLLDEALGTAQRIRAVGSRERGLAADEVRQARSSIQTLSIVPPVTDLVDGLIDQEIRGTVRGLSAPKRDALLEEMRGGGQVRAMLAAARHPMPSDFDVEAARLYAEFSEPQKRSTLTLLIEIYESKKAAAQTLINAADASKAVVAKVVQLEAALAAEASNADAMRQAATITRPDGPPSTTTSGAAPTQWSRPSVQIEGNAVITRAD